MADPELLRSHNEVVIDPKNWGWRVLALLDGTPAAHTVANIFHNFSKTYFTDAVLDTETKSKARKSDIFYVASTAPYLCSGTAYFCDTVTIRRQSEDPSDHTLIVTIRDTDKMLADLEKMTGASLPLANTLGGSTPTRMKFLGDTSVAFDGPTLEEFKYGFGLAIKKTASGEINYVTHPNLSVQNRLLADKNQGYSPEKQIDPFTKFIERALQANTEAERKITAAEYATHLKRESFAEIYRQVRFLESVRSIDFGLPQQDQ